MLKTKIMKAKTLLPASYRKPLLNLILLLSISFAVYMFWKSRTVKDQRIKIGKNTGSVKATSLAQANNHTIARLTRLEVKPKYQKLFREAISRYVLYSLETEGNILSEAYYEQEGMSVWWLIERWDDKTKIDIASKGAEFKAIDSLSVNALTKPAKTYYVKDLEPLSKEEWRRVPAKNDTPITIMLFVDSKAGTQDKFKKVYHIAMPLFRSEPGVINYQLSQFENDSTQFVTYEKFRNEGAFQYHLNFPPVQPIIEYLNTSIKKQPFQAGLHRLIEFAPLTGK
jgi:quinol monooxygenase YgiN